MTKILFVCTGNICRSPMAQAVLQQMAKKAEKNVIVASAGTGGWHVGERPDKRALNAATIRHYDTTGIIAQQINVEDMLHFDIIYAMAKDHLDYLLRLAPEQEKKIKLFLKESCHKNTDVPDPYYGDDSEFEIMMNLIEEGCQHIIHSLP